MSQLEDMCTFFHMHISLIIPVLYFFIIWLTHYIYIYAFSRRFYPKRLTITFRLYIFISMCVPWELNPQLFALLTQCSTTEPHRNTITINCLVAQMNANILAATVQSADKSISFASFTMQKNQQDILYLIRQLALIQTISRYCYVSFCLGTWS